MTPATAKAVVAKRPFLSVTALDQALTAAGLKREQITALYGRIFIHINLNTASKDEILLIPGVGQRMLTSVSKRMAGEFFRNVGAAIAGGGPAAAPAEPVAGGAVFTAPAKPETVVAFTPDFLKGIAVGAALVALGVLLGRRRR